MILTLTPVPSLDRTATSAHEIAPNTICDLADITTMPGGAGVNVAHTLYCAGRETLAVFPAPDISHYMRLMAVTGTPHRHISVPGPIQMHYTITDHQGAVTILKDPPMPLDPTQLAMLRDLTVTLAEDASWVLLAGPLPNIANAAWYVEVLRALALYHPQVRVIVSTRGSALQALVRQLAATQPHVLAVTVSELAEITGMDAADASEEAIINAANEIVAAGVSEVLVMVQRTHALLINNDGAWSAHATGASGHQSIHWNESFLAGYLSAAEDNAEPTVRLSTAVAYSHAAGSEWDNFLPTPNLVSLDSVHCVALR